jgi:hypothetical protein
MPKLLATRTFLPTAAVCGMLLLVGCGSSGMAADDTAITSDEARTSMNAAAVSGLPPLTQEQILLDLEGASITGVETRATGADTTVFSVNYIMNGDAKQRIYDRDGNRLGVTPDVIGDEQPGPGVSDGMGESVGGEPIE